MSDKVQVYDIATRTASAADPGTVTGVSFTNSTYATGAVANPSTAPAVSVVAINGSRQYVSQSSHGFVVGDVLRRDAGAYVKAQADSATNAEVAGIVIIVPDSGTFVLLMEGLFPSGLSALTDGTTYFLSPTTAGAMTATEPSTVGQVSKPVFIANSAVGGFFVNMRGTLITASILASSIVDGDTTHAPDGNSVFDALAGKVNNTQIPTVYEANIAGSVASEEVNQFAMGFTVTNPSTGEYAITADSGTPFTAGKTKVSAVALGNNIPGVMPKYIVNSTTVITVTWYDKDGSADPADGFAVFVRVYA